jgi:iron complex transport system ATP-binding protein
MKLKINGMSFSYGSRPALADVTMSVDGGEVVSLVGPNGSGKTTLIKCINRILKPKGGTVLVEEKDVGKIKLKGLARLLAYVPQSAAHSFPSTVFDTVLLGRRPYVNWGISPRDKEVVSQMLSLMELEEMALRQFNELSGGERQKVLIARALAQEPQVLLLDEPTSNLDLKHQLEVLGIVRSIVKEKGIAAVMAIHDLNLAARFSDKLIFLDKGRIYDAGEPAQVLTQENIRRVYGVEAIISKNSGHPHIIPLAPVAAKESQIPRR